MIYKLYYTPTFKKRLKKFLKKHPDLEKEVENKIDILIKNPFHPNLRAHKVFDIWAIWITWEYRLVFEINNDKICLLNIGTHDEVY